MRSHPATNDCRLKSCTSSGVNIAGEEIFESQLNKLPFTGLRKALNEACCTLGALLHSAVL